MGKDFIIAKLSLNYHSSRNWSLRTVTGWMYSGLLSIKL